MNYISRIDSHRTHGWQVRVPANGKVLGLADEFFSDAMHGGKESAHQAAAAARDRMLATEHVVALPTSKSKHARNSTGIIGLAWQEDSRRGNRGGAWMCYWNEAGRQRKKSFSPAKYGFLEAWELALQHRLSHTDAPPTPAQIQDAKLDCMKRMLVWLGN